ncbi:hypothetical protein B0H13DRAFT_1971550 [Mycena leptocephala]|nr:hypothetical protein B0H13DRAFT_1971550 [Mycena leptocephala]
MSQLQAESFGDMVSPSNFTGDHDQTSPRTGSSSPDSGASSDIENGAVLQGLQETHNTPPNPTSHEAHVLDALDLHIAPLPDATAASPNQPAFLDPAPECAPSSTTYPASLANSPRISSGDSNDKSVPSSPITPRKTLTPTRDDFIFPTSITNRELAAGVMGNPNRDI